MPLKSPAPVPIPARNAIAPLGMSVGAPGTLVPLLPQQARNWCWAACVEMIAKWKDASATLRQCELASTQFMAVCCTSPVTAVCDMPLSINKIQPLWDALGIQAVYVPNALNPQVVLAEVSAGRPVQLALFHSQGGHVVLVTHVGPDPFKVIVLDPAPVGVGTRTTASLEYLAAGLNIGRWRFTWTGLG